MPPDIADIANGFNLTENPWLGIPIALLGAVFLSFGAQFQHRGVGKVDSGRAVDAGGLNIRQLLGLLARPSWVIGSVLLGMAIVLQLTALTLAPITVVQPLGALALVITAMLSARASGVPLDAISIRAIAFCVGGIGLFVAVAASTAVTRVITRTELIIVLVVLGAVLATFAVLFATLRQRFTSMFYVVAAGVLFGFVVTLAKVVIARVQTILLPSYVSDPAAEWLTALCVIALLLASALGFYFVQTAYATGPPDLVIAGLTVIDPLVAVSIGIIVLGEAGAAPPWAVGAFVVFGALAIYGVLQLAKHHPQKRR